ncbi:MAG TPA: hypothetical protein VKA19_09365, partial [Alphaproteobacteria bacterium]|nr:hypothetical protein [Alphaproteobacteria bacterium]
SLNANLSARLGHGVSLTANADHVKESDGTRSVGFLLTLSVSFAQSRQTVIATTNTRDRVTRLDWGYAPPTAINHLAANAVVQRRPQAHDLAVSLGALTNRLDIGMTHDLTIPREEDEKTSAATTLALGTSVALAQGHVSVGRPISNSFAMVVPHPNLENIAVGADRVAGTYAAQTDFLGPAVIPDVEPYFQRNTTIDAPDLPIGYDLGQTEFSLELTHKSGALLQVGTDAVVLLGGTVVDSEGRPVSLKAGEITSLDEPNRDPVLMFTNRGGRFRMEGFKPGRYRLRMRFDPRATVTIQIPEDARGQYDAGMTRLPVALPDKDTNR